MMVYGDSDNNSTAFVPARLCMLSFSPHLSTHSTIHTYYNLVILVNVARPSIALEAKPFSNTEAPVRKERRSIERRFKLRGIVYI